MIVNGPDLIGAVYINPGWRMGDGRLNFYIGPGGGHT